MRPSSALLPLLISFSLVGCADILGLGEYKEGPDTGTGASSMGGSGPTTSSASTTMSSSTSSTSSTTNSSSSVSSTSSGMMVCAPNEVVPCDHYDGMPGTEGHGLCTLGTMRCNPEGSAYGPCDDQVIDVAEVCGDGLDQDCDGTSDDGCTCTPNASTPCYGGSAGTEGVGICKGGMQTCNASGTMLGQCMGDVVPGTEVCADGSGDEDCNGLRCSEPKWAAFVGDSALQLGGDVTVDPTGNVYWVGGFAGTMMFPGGTTLVSAGGQDVFVSKWSSAGTLLWAKRFGAATSEGASGVSADGSFVYVVTAGGVDFGGGLKTGMTVTKLSGTNGNHVWSRGCGSAYESGAGTGPSISVDGAGGVAVGASFEGTSYQCEGGPSLAGQTSSTHAGVVVKYDAGGVYKWGKTFVPTNGNSLDLTGLDTDSANSIWFTGYTRTMSTFGCTGTLGMVNQAPFLVRFDANGTCSLQLKFDSGTARAFDVAVDSAGAAIIIGDYAGSFSIGPNNFNSGSSNWFVAKFSSAGAGVWSQTIGGSGTDYGYGVGFDSKDDVVAAGSVGGTVNIGGYVYTSNGFSAAAVKLSKATGAPQWATYFGPGSVLPAAIAAGGPEDVIFFSGTNQAAGNAFGSFSPSYSDGVFGGDAFLARVDP